MAHRRPGPDRPATTHLRTRPGRLAALDRALLVLEGARLRGDGPALVDVGIGLPPVTTLEWAATLREAGCVAEVVGVDVDPAVLEAAAALSVPGVRFLASGFDLPVRARVVRVMNVLREAPVAEIPAIHARLGAALVDGGVLVEGSTDLEGDAACALWIRRRADGLVREALVFHLSGARGCAPVAAFSPLPRDLRRRWEHTPLAAFRADWDRAFAEVRRKGVPARVLAAETFTRLADRRTDVPRLPECWADGTLVWRPEDGVPVG